MHPLTHSCFLLLLLGRLSLLALFFLFGICLVSLWSPPSPAHAPNLIFLSRQSATLTHLDSLPFIIWYSGLTALFCLLLAKAALAYLPTAFSVTLKPPFPFQQAQYVQVFPLRPAPFCTLFADFNSTNKSAISLLLLSDSCSVLATQSSPPSFLLPQSLLQIWQELSSLSPCSIRLQLVPGHSFLPGNDAADELARRGALLVPSATPCSLSPLISHILSSLFLGWRHTVSSKLFNTQIPSISIKKLVLPRHARCVLSRLCCNRHCLLLSSCLFRISRIDNSSCSACGHLSQNTSHLILHCPATDSSHCSLFGDSLSLYDLWSRPWGVARLLALYGLPPCPHPLEGVG